MEDKIIVKPIQWRQMDLTEAEIKRWNGVRPMVEGEIAVYFFSCLFQENNIIHNSYMRILSPHI